MAQNTGFENSKINKRPPGFSTRYIDLSAASLFVTLRRTKADSDQIKAIVIEWRECFCIGKYKIDVIAASID